MKHLLGFILILLSCSTSVAAGDFADVNVQKINDRVYALLGGSDVPKKENGGYVNNILVVIGDKGVILVDAGSHKSIAEHVNKSIKKITSKPVTHILITHHHGDHHLGASFYSGAEVISSEYCAKQIEENGQSMIDAMVRMTGLSLKSTSPVIPGKRLQQNKREQLVINGVKLELITPGNAHTDGDMMVFLPDDGVLATGDILLHGVNPNIVDGNLKKWLVVMDDIRKMPLKTIMPGHGDLMHPQDISEFQELMASLYKITEDTFKAGGDMSDVRGKLDLAKWQRLSRFEDMMGRNISKVWEEVEIENF